MAAYRWSVRAARPIKLRVPTGASVGTFWFRFQCCMKNMLRFDIYFTRLYLHMQQYG